ncbi:MAG: B12-binding domain-containing radical SAM protein, partial [bacterium]
KKFRAHSAGFVLKEMESCVELGIRDFIIYDDTFTVNRKRVVAICRGILERKWEISWDIRARVTTVDLELLKLMKKAGCQGIHYGIEAGTEKILRVLQKGITIKQATEVFKMTKRLGIKTLGYFMIGSPTETAQDIEETFRVARRLNPDFIHLTIFTPFPGTQIYFDGLKQGVLSRDIWKEFARNPSPDFIPPHWGEMFTRQELQKMLISGYKGFYGRPGYIIKELLKVKSLSDLRRKARAGLKVLFHKSD